MRRDPFGHNHMKTPLFFKIWFAFIALLVLSVFLTVGFVGFIMLSVASDPGIIGRSSAEIVRGFSDTLEANP